MAKDCATPRCAIHIIFCVNGDSWRNLREQSDKWGNFSNSNTKGHVSYYPHFTNEKIKI